MKRESKKTLVPKYSTNFSMTMIDSETSPILKIKWGDKEVINRYRRTYCNTLMKHYYNMFPKHHSEFYSDATFERMILDVQLMIYDFEKSSSKHTGDDSTVEEMRNIDQKLKLTEAFASFSQSNDEQIKKDNEEFAKIKKLTSNMTKEERKRFDNADVETCARMIRNTKLD